MITRSGTTKPHENWGLVGSVKVTHRLRGHLQNLVALHHTMLAYFIDPKILVHW